MFGGRKRPWKDYAQILRIETNGGDVKFRAEVNLKTLASGKGQYGTPFGTFESLSEAEAALDGWFAEWWPTQEKSVRKA